MWQQPRPEPPPRSRPAFMDRRGGRGPEERVDIPEDDESLEHPVLGKGQRERETETETETERQRQNKQRVEQTEVAAGG